MSLCRISFVFLTVSPIFVASLPSSHRKVIEMTTNIDQEDAMATTPTTFVAS